MRLDWSGVGLLMPKIEVGESQGSMVDVVMKARRGKYGAANKDIESLVNCQLFLRG